MLVSSIFYYQGDPAKLNTVLCPGTIYNAGTAFKSVIYGVTNATVAAAANQYFISAMGANTVARVILGQDTTYSNMYCSDNVAPGGTETQIFTVYTGADTPVTCTITGAGRSCSDLTHTTLAATGGVFAFHVISSAAAAGSAVQCSVTAESK
jgi:hypothetical protein